MKGASFIVETGFGRQVVGMRGSFVTLSFGLFALGGGAFPDIAMARETEPAESANCVDPKHRHVVVRPLTESLPIRKSEKLRVRRILM